MSLEHRIEDAVKEYENRYGNKPEFALIEAGAASLYLDGKFGAPMNNKDYTLLGVDTLSGCKVLVVPKIGYEIDVFSANDLNDAVMKYQDGDNTNYKVVIEKEKLITKVDSATLNSIVNYELEHKEIHFVYIDTYMTYKEFHPN